MEKRLTADHGIVCRLPDRPDGYFGWPSVARMDDGTCVVACSGLRTAHICPFGKTVICTSGDDGLTWSPPRVIQDSPIDDRDAGVVATGGRNLLVSWFRSDTRIYARDGQWAEVLSRWTDEMVNQFLGSWIMLSDDGGETWSSPIRVPVSAPHGPICLSSGRLLYLGKDFRTGVSDGMIHAATSDDGGKNWAIRGTVPVYPRTHPANYHEPHAVELPSGRLVGMIRLEDQNTHTLAAAGIPSFSMVQTVSDDGGATWSEPVPLKFHGSPPHLLRHSSGVLILTYGYRLAPYGQRVALSYDNGTTWDHDWILRDDGPDNDLGYPATVEIPDQKLLTVYYQKAATGERCSILRSHWHLPQTSLQRGGHSMGRADIPRGGDLPPVPKTPPGRNGRRSVRAPA